VFSDQANSTTFQKNAHSTPSLPFNENRAFFGALFFILFSGFGVYQMRRRESKREQEG
jgi:hypothetical protein